MSKPTADRLDEEPPLLESVLRVPDFLVPEFWDVAFDPVLLAGLDGAFVEGGAGGGGRMTTFGSNGGGGGRLSDEKSTDIKSAGGDVSANATPCEPIDGLKLMFWSEFANSSLMA